MKSVAPEKAIWHAYESRVRSKHIWVSAPHHIDGAWYIYVVAGEKEDICLLFIIYCNLYLSCKASINTTNVEGTYMEVTTP